MKKIITFITSLYFLQVATAQTLQTVTTSGNITSNAIRVGGEGNIGTTGTSELVLGVLSAQKTNDTRAFIGWKNDAVTNPTTNGSAGSLLLQPRTNLTDMSIDFATGYLTPALRMRIAGNGNVSIGDNSLIPASRLLIKGSGTTSSTTSLLVQNSVGTNLFKVLDNGFTTVNNVLTLAGTQQTPNYLLANEYADNAQLLIRAGSSGTVYSQIEVTGNWDGAANTGGKVALTTAGVERMRINAAGNMGIGTVNPVAKLDIVGAGGSSIDLQTTGRVKIKSTSPGIWLNDNTSDKAYFGYAVGYANHAAGIFTSGSGQWNSFNVFQDGSVSIGSSINNTNAKLDVTGNIYCNSKMYIGTKDANTASRIANYSLAVNGTAIFNKAKVLLYDAPWPDYVFEEKYGLQPLEALESFIKSNKHLPNVPTAAEVEKDGLDLGNNQTLLLQKIEELTLYIIEQNKKLNQQQEQINQLVSQSKKAN